MLKDFGYTAERDETLDDSGNGSVDDMDGCNSGSSCNNSTGKTEATDGYKTGGESRKGNMEVNNMDELQVFENEEFGQVRTVEIDGKPYFCANDIAKALGYAKPNNAVSAHCRSTLKQGIATKQGNFSEMLFIPEGDVYRLIVKSKLPTAEKFERWVFDEVLPIIRKTGGYVNNDDLFINTYLPFADESTKTLFKTTLDVVRSQNELIRKQNKEIEQKDMEINHRGKELSYKSNIINGLVKDVGLADKRQIINKIWILSGYNAPESIFLL